MSTPLQRAESRRLHQLCDALVDGVIEPPALEELQGLLSGRIAARREYVRIMGLSSSLHLYAAEADIPRVPVPEPVAAAPPTEERRPSWWSRPELALAGAAAALVLAGVGFHHFHSRAIDPPNPQVEIPPAVQGASLVAATDPRWQVGESRSEVSLPPGKPLPGGLVHLVGGMAEVAFDSGARVVLQAPVSFEVLGADAIRVEHGKLSADLSEASAVAGEPSFAVHSPSGVVADRGTALGFEIDDLRRSEVHTLDGVVEWELADGFLPVRAGEASRLPEAEGGKASLADNEKIPFDADRWPKDVDSPGRSEKFVFSDEFNAQREGKATTAGSTVWEDSPVDAPAYRTTDPSRLEIRDDFLVATPEQEELRLVLERDLRKLAGDQFQIGFEGVSLVQDGSASFGFALRDGEGGDEGEAVARLSLSILDSDTVAAKLVVGGETLLEEQVPLDEITVKTLAVVTVGEDGAEMELSLNGVSLGTHKVGAISPGTRAELFAEAIPGATRGYYLDDFQIKQF